MLRVSELEYDLPPELIATTPAEPRDAARLLVVRASDARAVEHAVVRDLPEFLTGGDTLVCNTTRVLPARLRGRRRDTGGGVEGLFLSERDPSEGGGWSVLLSAGSHLRPGLTVDLIDPSGRPANVALRLRERDGEAWNADVQTPDGVAAPSGPILQRVGLTPLPPYILKARRDAHTDPGDASDRAWYQTVYADRRWAGSIAAPTAGLHFTDDLLARLRARGIDRRDVVLHVGEGTFKPVKAEYVEEHDIHAEWAHVPPETVRLAGAPAGERGRVIAVGTTTARALESLPAPLPPAVSSDGWSGWTRVLITPGWRWRRLDGLLTNFHLPRSTLMALVAAMLPEGPERLRAIYREAVGRRYRFYSYGDAMLILP